MKRHRLYLSLIFIFILFGGCVSKNGVIKFISHEGTLNPTDHHKIEFGSFSGNGGTEFASLLKDKVSRNGQYEVYLEREGSGDTQVLIQGEIITEFEEKEVLPQDTTCYREKTGTEYPCKWFYRKGNAVVSGNMEVFDKMEGNLLRHFDMSAPCPEQNASELKRRPPRFDERKLISECLMNNADAIYKILFGWIEQRTLSFEKNASVFGMNQVIKGLELDSSNMESAVKGFCKVIEEAENSKQVSRQDFMDAYWNLGLAYEYTGQYQNASEIFAELFKADTSMNSLMFWKKGNKYKNEYAKLKGLKAQVKTQGKHDQKICTDLRGLQTKSRQER